MPISPKTPLVAPVQTSGKEEIFSSVVAIVVALENYRTPTSGDALPQVEFAHADADAFAETLRDIYSDMPSESLHIEVMKDADASLTALKDVLGYRIRQLAADDLFIFYYAGHGFHEPSGNRLSAYDTNAFNVAETSLHMRDKLLEPLAASECKQALIFVDACASKFSGVVESRDVISDLDTQEVEEFLDSGWYLGVFLSCSPGEKSYPARTVQHGVWTYHLLQALTGLAEDALTQDRWLTDYGLRDYLRREVPRYITREMQVRGTQTPQAIITGTNSFRLRHLPARPKAPANAALAGIKLKNHSEYLESVETGSIRSLNGFERRYHTVPDKLSTSADNWVQRLLKDQVEEELQNIYLRTKGELGVRRRDLRKETGDLTTPVFRYMIITGQNPEDPSEYIIQRRLELRQGWTAKKSEIEAIFGGDFDRIIIELDCTNLSFDKLVDRLEDIAAAHGGSTDDDDRTSVVSYSSNGTTFTFDLKKRRVEVSFSVNGCIDLIEALQGYQLNLSGRSSPLLPAPRITTGGGVHPDNDQHLDDSR
ncbi:hypothetical protein GAY30_04990 [Azospirillum brasilense]|nr:hypothetical protein [Azospirillum brasilense]NUB30117.1 hypothetical protein [Azospirillum brasilense]RIW04973.1 hypothetical protein D2T81_09075 [Azospirillum brasilense]